MPVAATAKIRFHNRIRVLLCYALAWSLALLPAYVLLTRVYPYRLVGTAPDLTPVADSLRAVLPEVFLQALDASRVQAGMGRAAMVTALAARETVWLYSVGGAVLAAALISLLIQLCWRFSFRRPRLAARTALRAVAAYRWSMLVIWLVNLLFLLGLYLLGVRRIAGRTAWDALFYIGVFIPIPLAATVCVRLAAPPSLSGKHGFFRRL